MLAVGTVALPGGGSADGEPQELVCWEEILRRGGKRPKRDIDPSPESGLSFFDPIALDLHKAQEG